MKNHTNVRKLVDLQKVSTFDFLLAKFVRIQGEYGSLEQQRKVLEQVSQQRVANERNTKSAQRTARLRS